MNSEHTYYLISDVNTIYEVDYQTDVIHRSYNGHHGVVLCLRYSPDGTSFISGSDDSSIRLWTVDRNYACFLQKQCVASIRCSIAFCMKRRLYVYSLPIQQESSHKWRRNAEITERNQSPRGSKQPFLCFPIATHHPTFYSPVPKLSRCNSQTMSSEAKPSVQAFGRKVRCDELCILIPNAL